MPKGEAILWDGTKETFKELEGLVDKTKVNLQYFPGTQEIGFDDSGHGFRLLQTGAWFIKTDKNELLFVPPMFMKPMYLTT